MVVGRACRSRASWQPPGPWSRCQGAAVRLRFRRRGSVCQVTGDLLELASTFLGLTMLVTQDVVESVHKIPQAQATHRQQVTVEQWRVHADNEAAAVLAAEAWVAAAVQANLNCSCNGSVCAFVARLCISRSLRYRSSKGTATECSNAIDTCALCWNGLIMCNTVYHLYVPRCAVRVHVWCASFKLSQLWQDLECHVQIVCLSRGSFCHRPIFSISCESACTNSRCNAQGDTANFHNIHYGIFTMNTMNKFQVQRTRQVQRSGRRKSGKPVVAVVGMSFP